MLAFKCLSGQAEEQKTLEEEYKRAEAFQEVRLGESHLFHRPFIRVKYISVSCVQRAFIRMERGESGDFPTTTIYIILIDRSGKEVRLHMERADTAKKMLARMQQKYPDISYGFTN